jgi:hypothetical protein
VPDAVIHGRMPSLRLRNGSAAEIFATVRRDFDALGRAGFCESPAGVVAAGTPFANLRAYMAVVEHVTGRRQD